MVVIVSIAITGLCSWDSEAGGCHSGVQKVLMDMVTTQTPVTSSAGISVIQSSYLSTIIIFGTICCFNRIAE